MRGSRDVTVHWECQSYDVDLRCRNVGSEWGKNAMCQHKAEGCAGGVELPQKLKRRRRESFTSFFKLKCVIHT